MQELAERLTDLGRLVGRDGQMDAFGREYGRLLAELQAALKLMRALAMRQGAWLQGQAGQAAREN
jgi:hypothetical protein